MFDFNKLSSEFFGKEKRSLGLLCAKNRALFVVLQALTVWKVKAV